MLDVFISYPHKAAKDASQLAKALRAQGLKTWYAEENLMPGEDQKIEIHSAIRDAKSVVVLIVPNSRPSSWQQEEYMAALESYWSGGKRLLVPVVIGEAEPPTFLQQWKSLKVKKAGDWKRAASQITKWLSTPNKSNVGPTRKAKEKRAQRLETIKELMQLSKTNSARSA